LDAAALLTARAACRARSRLALQSSGGQPQHSFQQHRSCRAPCLENTFFVIVEAVITMCLGVLQQASTELRQRLYDLIRDVVVGIHVAFPDPPLL